MISIRALERHLIYFSCDFHSSKSPPHSPGCKLSVGLPAQKTAQALLVQKYRKMIAKVFGNPDLELVHPFKERGEWNGEMTIDCCKKEDKGEKK